MSAIMICLGKEQDEAHGGILRLLKVLLSSERRARATVCAVLSQI